MRATPFTARLLAATALGLTTSSAYAADYGILVSDPNPAPLNLFNGSLITGDKTGLLSTGGRLNISISGYTWIIGNGGHGGAVSPDGGIVINGDGADIRLVFEDPAVSPPVVEGARFGITTAYFFNSATGEFEGRATGTTVTNNGGTIIGDSDDGVRLIGGGSITNSGYIAGMIGSSADGVSMFAFDDQDTSAMTGIGTVTNLLGGTIQGQRFGVILSGGGNIDNSGMIQGNDGGGVLIQARSDVDLGKIGTVTNSGTGSILGGVRFNSLDSATLDNAGIITSANNNGSSPLRAGVESWNPLSLTNAATGDIYGATNGITSNGSSLTLDNAGTIRGDGSSSGYFDGNGGVIIAGGPATITNSGIISGARYGISTIYFTDPETGQQSGLATGTTINNSGVISGDNDDAIHLIGGGTVTNSGQLLGLNASGVVMFAFDGQDFSQVTDLGTVNNLAGGLIQGSLAVFIGDGGTVNNAGTITGDFRAVEIARWWDPGRAGAVNNSGTINGNIDFDSLDSASVNNSGTIANPTGDAIISNSTLTVDNTDTGSITGSASGIRTSGPSLTVANDGTIRGNGGNGSVFNSDGGIIISGGPAAITNTGNISGARFGISTIYFTNPDNSTVGRAIGTAVGNSGSIIGENDDGIRLIGGGTVTNSGYISGRTSVGADGISMFAYNGQNTAGMTSIGSVTNLAGGLIQGNRFGVVLFGGGTVDNAGTIDHTVNVAGSPLLGAGQFGIVNNSGSIINGGISLASLEAANVNNSGDTPTIGFAGDGTASVVNSGTVNYFTSFSTVGTATVDNGGSIGEGLVFKQTTTANVTNSGSITATNTPDVVGTTRDAVYSDAALLLTNTSTGSINGFRDGVRTDGTSATINNAGTIRGLGTNSGQATPGAGIVVSGGPSTITNSGSISGARFGLTTSVFTDPSTQAQSGRAIASTVNNSGSIIGDNDDGVRLIGGGTVTNSGYIAGRVTAGADGVSMFAFNDQNTANLPQIGAVNNLAGGTIEGFRFGIIQSGGGTINNAGTINGGTNGAILIQTGLIGGKSGNLTNSGTINGATTFFELVNAIIANSGTMSSSSTAAITSSLTNGPMTVNNGATGSIAGATSGILGAGSSLSLTNAGLIRGNGSYDGFAASPDGGIDIAGGPANIQNSGTISGQRFGITTSYVLNPNTNLLEGRATGSTIANTGTIIGDTDDGIRLIGGGTVTNSGYIAGRVGAGADGVSMFSFSDQNLTSFTVIGSVTNSPSGVIEGNRFGVILSNGGNVSNAGTITGKSGSILLQAQAVGAEPPRNGSVTNSGTLNGTVQFNNLANASVANSGSISALSGNGVFTTAPGGSLTVNNQATGAIAGASSGIRSEGSGLSVTNAGTIRGNGTLFTLRAADAGILILGGPATINNSGNISGAGFGITTGVYSDPNNNAASGRAAGSTVTNSGSIIGDSNDGVRLIGGGTVTNSGYIAGRVGAGADGVSMFAYDDQDTTALPQIGTVNNLAGSTIEGFRFGIIQSGGGTINNAGTINGGANGAILIQTGFIGGKTGNVTNSGTINGSTSFYDLTTAAVTNSGLMNGGVSFDTVPTATLANTGTINGGSSNGLTANNNVTVTNSAAGSITGASGIYSTGGSPLTLTNAGTITGGSGFGAYSAGSINISNSGAINSNSSGISSLGGGSVTNGGSIISSNGAGISFSGNTSTATLTNAAGALIQGSVQGILADSNVSATVTNAGLVKGDVALLGPSGSLSNSGTINGLVVFSGSTAALSNSGTIASAGGPAVSGVRVLTNSGVINGGIGTTVSMTSDNDIATLQTGSSISGAVDGGNGSDTLRLSGTISTPTASQTVGRFLNFETFNVLGGYWTAPTTTGSFTTTTLSGGALAVNGTLTSPVVVNAAAILAGTGTITGNVTMNTGGIISPGTNSIGTLNVAGNVLFNSGSTFSVQTNPNGTSDRLAVTGAVNINKGATLQVLAGIFPNYPATSSYLVMTANGGISGKFDTVVTDYAYFKATVNTQQKGTITVQIAPNGKPLPSAATVSTFSTASAVDSLGTTSPIYEKVLYQSLTGARQAFTSLSGSAYARLDGLMASDIGRVELGFDSDQSAAPTLEWSTANSFTARGLQSATAMGRGKLSLMMVGGRYSTQLATESIRADVDTRFLASAAGYRSGRFQALASVTSAWHNVSVERTVAFPGFADRTSARYAAESHRVDLEGSYALTRGAIAIAPYGGLSHLMMKSQAFEESGGVSTLAFGHDSRTIDQLRLGVRARATFALGPVKLSPHADVSFNRSWGDVEAAREARFVTGNAGFDSIGTGLDSRLTDIDAGIDAKLGRVTLTGGYRGRLGNRWRDHSALLRAALQF